MKSFQTVMGNFPLRYSYLYDSQQSFLEKGPYKISLLQRSAKFVMMTNEIRASFQTAGRENTYIQIYKYVIFSILYYLENSDKTDKNRGDCLKIKAIDLGLYLKGQCVGDEKGTTVIRDNTFQQQDQQRAHQLFISYTSSCWSFS